MFSADPYVLDFIRGNFVSLGMVLALLKGVAKLTPGTHDDKIVTLLQRVCRMTATTKSDPESGVSVAREVVPGVYKTE